MEYGVLRLLGLAVILGGMLWGFHGGGISSAYAGDGAHVAIQRGTLELGLQSGYWQAFTGIGAAQSANRSAVFVLPRLGYVFTDPIELGYLSGAFEVFAEPVAAHFIQPFSATLVGFSLGMRYNFLAFGPWLPYWDIGAGVSWTDLAPRIPEQSTPFEFLLETGPGIQYFLTARTAVSLAVRWHHISNGGIGDRNTGLNAVLGLIGFTVFFPK
ncbi:MAG: acyloxyacyl hydrolase [Nitrospirae bacterium]|nr:MAG: acyloxyacyl hydrolase [Nitrospirota bacterium]